MSKRAGNPTDFESFLTWEALTEVLSYDPGTGEFRWVKSPRPGWAGRIAGHVNPLHGGYREITLSGRTFRASRLAWLHETKEWPKGVVDHINGKRDDDRWANLRDASLAENALNRALNSNSDTGVPGVHWAPIQERYIARLLSPQTSTQKSRQTACLGMHSLGAVLGVLGLKIALVHDEEAWDQVKDRLEKRKGSFVRRGVISRDISRVYFQRIGRKGGLARWAGIDGPKRKAIMSKAHIARWRAHKIAKAKRFADGAIEDRQGHMAP